MRSQRHRRGAALVITLSMLVLVTILAVAFFARTQLNQQVEAGVSGREQAETTAHGAMEAVVSDLMAEIRAASTNASPPFRPTTNTAIPPARVVQPGLAGTPNVLVKQSIPAGPLVPEGAPYTASTVNRILPAASAVSTATAAAEGRVISANRWNSIRLLEQPPQNAADLPNWIYLSRSGFASPQSIAPSWSDSASANGNFIVGRVAFNIYDTSGLLNANAAGYPQGVGPTDLARIKGTLAGAALTVLPGVTTQAISDLVAFRNPDAVNYADFVTTTAVRSGFANHVMTSPGGANWTNSFFVNRQDLIRYATRQNPGLAGALPFLVHKRPSRNAPASRPPYNAAEKIGGSGDADFQYRTHEADASALNRDVLTVTLPNSGNITGHRTDGTSFTYPMRAGDPLIQRRFPLPKLAWLGPSGPVGVPAAAVQHSFGLRWDSGKGYWEYVGPTGASLQTQIATLAEVAQQMREPDFFELLQAGILGGSLGVSYGNVQLGDPAWQNNITLQILRIGACIIDQADGDSFPTVVEFSSPGGAPFWRAVGVEDLPYIETVQTLVGDKPSSSSLVPYVACRLFNPHRASSVAPSAAPRIRLGFAGGMRFRSWWGIYPNANNDPRIPQMIISVPSASPVTSAPMAGLSAADAFRQARLPANGDFIGGLPDTLAQVPTGPVWSQLPSVFGGTGLRMPDFEQNLTKTGPPSSAVANLRNFLVYYGYRGSVPVDHGNFFIEFETPDGRWIPYSFWTGINDPVTWASTTPYFTSMVCSLPGGAPDYVYTGIPFEQAQLARHVMAIRSDPRSFRINGFLLNQAPGMDQSPMPAMWSTANTQGSGYGGTDSQQNPRPSGVPAAPLGQRAPLRQSYTGVGQGYYYPGWLSRNFAAVASSRISAYEDADGIRRLGDSGRYGNDNPGNVAPSVGNPYMRDADCPVVLNRPFRNIGELGYAFRDLPWKTLDFFSENSADAALLDLFTLADTDVRVVEDRINLQAAPVLVLEALLAGSALDPATGAPILSADDAEVLAEAIHGMPERLDTTQDLILSALGPLSDDYTNPSSTTELEDSVFGGSDNARIKTRREVISRVLGSLSDDRTWLLTVDLVAQAGRFAPGATDAARFIVQGERRYWLHLAIDRYTGEIVSRSMEAVQE